MVRPGEKIPVDGVVLDGTSSVVAAADTVKDGQWYSPSVSPSFLLCSPATR